MSYILTKDRLELLSHSDERQVFSGDLVAELASMVLTLQSKTNEWIPCSESLPKIEDGRLCTYEIEVAYRHYDFDQKEYYRKVTRFWKDEGFEYGHKFGKLERFEDYGYTIDYYRYLPELPALRRGEG